MSNNTYAKIPQPLDNIGCQDLLKETVSISGWIRKRHFTKLKLFRWPKIFAVVCKGCIYYFRNEYCKSITGKFSLFGYNTITRATDVKDNEAIFAFKIDHTHKDEFKSFYFACASEKEMKTWMKTIKDELKLANDPDKRDGDYYYTQGFQFQQTPEHQGSSADSGFGPSADGDTASIDLSTIEESIYDDPSSFKPPEDYGTYAKRADEVSDEDDIPDEPPPVPPRLAEQSDKKHRRRKKKKKKKDKDNEEEIPDVSRVSLTKTNAEAKDAAKALSSEMKDLFGKRKQSSTESTSSTLAQKKQSSVEQAPAQAAMAEEDDGEESEDEEDKYWKSIHFHGGREEANEIIRSIGENGVFLVRSGGEKEGEKVLVVFADNIPKKFLIKYENNQYNIASSGPKAESLEELLYEYFTINLPNISVKLTTPFQLHPSYQ